MNTDKMAGIGGLGEGVRYVPKTRSWWGMDAAAQFPTG